MKITKRQLRRIIKEEVQKIIEGKRPPGMRKRTMKDLDDEAKTRETDFLKKKKEEEEQSMRVEPDVQGGLWQNAVDGIWRWLDDEAMAGTVDMSDPAVQGTFADALETVASELRKGSQS